MNAGVVVRLRGLDAPYDLFNSLHLRGLCQKCRVRQVFEDAPRRPRPNLSLGILEIAVKTVQKGIDSSKRNFKARKRGRRYDQPLRRRSNPFFIRPRLRVGLKDQ